MRLTNANVIRSVSDDQEEIIKNILMLYAPMGIDIDPTYSKGNFYKNIPKPKYCFDISPCVDGVEKADSRDIPLPDKSANCIMFDPPFVGGSVKNGKTGVIKDRFSYFKNIPILWDFYEESIMEFYRLLKDDGVLIFKNQDTIESAKQYLSHIEIHNMCVYNGFYAKDLFILTAKNRILRGGQKQQHSRKYHSYFSVFIKKKSPVKYFNIND